MINRWLKGWLVTLLVIVPSSVLLAKPKQISVFVSIFPQKYFVEKIGGDAVDVKVMVAPGMSPHTFEPKPRQMMALSKTDIYFSIGVEFEKAWIKKIVAANENMKLIAMDRSIDKIAMTAHHDDEEEDNHDMKDEDHEGPDPHIWLSPQRVKQISGTILQTLQDLDPERSAQYQAHYQQFMEEISALDNELKTLFAGKAGYEFIVFHPSWGYFAEDYHLKQIPIEIEGKNPKPAQIVEVVKFARERGIRVIFAQPQFSVRNANIIAKEINGDVVLVDPLAENWGENMRMVSSLFSRALKK